MVFDPRFVDPITRRARQLMSGAGLADQILQSPEDFGATPGIVPSKPQRLPSVLGSPRPR